MKSTFVFTLVSTILRMAAANKIDKYQLCNEVCWTYHVNDHEECKTRCLARQRPTEEEAGQCQTCIDRCCGDYLADYTNTILYAECRQGCFATYFPQYTIRRSEKFPKQKEHVPGLPPRIQNTLGGHLYPVETAICELSCRAQGADSILSGETTMEKCVTVCKGAPSPREQELQMTLDCAEKCPRLSDTCIKSCVHQHAQSRATNVNFSGTVALSSTEAKPSSSEGTPTPTLNAGAGNVTFPLIKSSKVRTISSLATSASKVVESDEEQIATSTPIANSSSETPTPEEKRRGGFYDSSSTGRSYFENIWFWIHAAGTIVIALVIGLQIV